MPDFQYCFPFIDTLRPERIFIKFCWQFIKFVFVEVFVMTAKRYGSTTKSLILIACNFIFILYTKYRIKCQYIRQSHEYCTSRMIERYKCQLRFSSKTKIFSKTALVNHIISSYNNNHWTNYESSIIRIIVILSTVQQSKLYR